MRKVKTMKFDYRYKKFSVLGDSISTLLGYSEPDYAAFYDTSHKIKSGVLTPSDTWWGIVIERLGGELLVNNSISGSTVTRHPLYEIPSYACSDERTSSLHKEEATPDVIMIYMGTNDWGSGVRVNDGERNSTSLFSPAYDTMLSKIKNNYPNAEIWCLTLPISSCESLSRFEFPYFFGGRHIDEYCEAIRSCAEKFGCRMIDLREFSSSEPYDTIDGFHPNAQGMQSIARGVLECIK